MATKASKNKYSEEVLHSSQREIRDASSFDHNYDEGDNLCGIDDDKGDDAEKKRPS